MAQLGKTKISKNKLGYKHLKSTKDLSRCPWYIYNGRPLSKKKERQDRGAGERARAGERQSYLIDVSTRMSLNLKIIRPILKIRQPDFKKSYDFICIKLYDFIYIKL